MSRLFLIVGSISAFLVVALGAFGAHGLRNRLSPELLDVFETAVRYQMYHAFGLVAVAWAVAQWPQSHVGLSGWMFVLGTILFSGSLYVLALTGARWLGVVTPVGGLFLLAGWGWFAWSVWKASQ
jgi:uncharacterized membrane protein YgdD (TMEM256/DUF423 family)